jgi:hypothetical protein
MLLQLQTWSAMRVARAEHASCAAAALTHMGAVTHVGDARMGMALCPL